MQWEILHIPEKPPSTLEQSLVDVLAATIEPKLANSFVRQLNQICPLENLRHVKRVRRRSVEGKIELSVILCLSDGHDNHIEGLSDHLRQLTNAYQLSPFKAKVAKYAALSKEEWEQQCKLWPTSYHPPCNLDGASGFSEEDSQMIFSYMKIAIQLSKLSQLADEVVNAAVIVDPVNRQVIATATDETCSYRTSANKTDMRSISTEQPATDSCHQSDTKETANNMGDSAPKLFPDENGLAKNAGDSVPKLIPDECTLSYPGVPCLNPWGWTAQRTHAQNSAVDCDSKYSWHPLRHATLVAIEKAAARDMKLFPGSESLSHQEDNLQHSSNIFPAKRQKTQSIKNEDILVQDEHSSSLPSEATRPYLCTGFDIYLIWEPCTMCAMALVHQRIRRIFYAFPNPNAGALGSVHRLQGVRSLNHHYSVFRILLPVKALHEVEPNSSDDSSLQD